MTIYILTNGERTGPFTIDQVVNWIRTGDIAMTDVASLGGESEWEPVHNIPEIVAALIPPLQGTKTATITPPTPTTLCPEPLKTSNNVSADQKAIQSQELVSEAVRKSKNPRKEIAFGILILLGSTILTVAICGLAYSCWEEDHLPRLGTSNWQSPLAKVLEKEGYKMPPPNPLIPAPQTQPQNSWHLYFTGIWLILLGLGGMLTGYAKITNGVNGVRSEKSDSASASHESS